VRAPRGRGRLFRFLHPRFIVYTTCWEDPAVDRMALDFSPGDRVLVITSAGCNALDYLLAGAGQVHAVDINPCQNALLELKVAALRTLDHAAGFELFGLGRSPRAREMYRHALRPLLSDEAQRYWDRNLSLFDGGGWRSSLFYRGTAGFAHRLLLGYATRALGLRPTFDELLAAGSVEEQREIFDRHRVRARLDTPLFRWLVSRPQSLAVMGIPSPQRAQIVRHEGGVPGYALDMIECALAATSLRSNYFWRAVLQGSYSAECCPEYLTPGGWSRLREGLLDRLTIHTDSVTRFLKSTTPGISKFVLLDHMDWMSSAEPDALSEEWSAILAAATSGARVIFRSAGRDVTYIDPLVVSWRGRDTRLGSLLRYDGERAAALHRLDRTRVYGSFYIAELPW
jgi:S-adenosylmethionine-diacylglycerol 3-amino-3-carboxypropyl transferase